MEYIFKQKIDRYQIDELQKRLPFLSEYQIDYIINYREGVAYSMTICPDSEIKIEELSQMLDYLMKDIYKIKNIPSKVVWEKEYFPSKSNLQEVLNSSYVYKNSVGQVTLSGDLLDLFNRFNELFAIISQRSFNSKAYEFPVLLPTRILEKTGYFEHNPYQWMKIDRLKKEIKNYQMYSKQMLYSTNNSASMCDSGYSLPPTMCYYVYDMLQNSSIDNSSYTTSGRAFRYEGDCDKPFERLVDFTIRETVFVGTRRFVEASVEKYMNYTIKLMDILGVCGRCETANDIFFMTDRTAERLNIQKMLGSKYELLLYVPDEKLVAVASFNKHGNFIGKRFNIHTNEIKNPIAYSACVGIGLERLVFSCVAQIGLEHIKQLVEDLKDPVFIIDQIEKCTGDHSVPSTNVVNSAWGADNFWT